MQWPINGLRTVLKYKRYLIMAGLGLALAGGLYTGGYLMGSRNEARIQIKEVEKRIYVPVTEIKEIQVRNVQRERALQRERDAARLVAVDLRTQLSNVPDPNPRTCLSPESVRLLNQAVANGAPSDPASVDPGTTDCVAPRQLELWAADAATTYNDVSARYNVLIDWVEEELIEPQRTGN